MVRVVMTPDYPSIDPTCRAQCHVIDAKGLKAIFCSVLWKI